MRQSAPWGAFAAGVFTLGILLAFTRAAIEDGLTHNRVHKDKKIVELDRLVSLQAHANLVQRLVDLPYYF